MDCKASYASSGLGKMSGCRMVHGWSFPGTHRSKMPQEPASIFIMFMNDPNKASICMNGMFQSPKWNQESPMIHDMFQ